MDTYVADGFQLSMRDVRFAYRTGQQVITDSCLQAKPGEIVALIGPSGEGKTTLIRLLLGLVQPQNGEVVMISSDGTEVPMNVETRHLFSYVPQGNTILSGTVEENLRLAKEDATEDEMIEALRISCAWDFVEKMPDGIHSPVGERGRGLSEGQSQRLAIARAVLRDAPILPLDEATSALDVTTERQVLKNIVHRQPNKTASATNRNPADQTRSHKCSHERLFGCRSCHNTSSTRRTIRTAARCHSSSSQRHSRRRPRSSHRRTCRQQP